MEILKAICIAFSTYSIIPMPQLEWNEKSSHYAICFLPAIGLVTGTILLLWYNICTLLKIGQALFAAIATALPILVSGGIHMDGFCDTVDALASHQPRKRSLEILTDPHIGAFAVIYAIIHMLISFGAYTELHDIRSAGILSLGFVLSRGLCVLSILLLPNAHGSGMLSAFTKNMTRRAVWLAATVSLSLSATGMLMLDILTGGISILLCIGWFFIYRTMMMQRFSGVTGDTSGFFIQITELLLLLGCIGGSFIHK